MGDLLNIHKVVVDKAIKMLDAAGATYAIQYNGELYGTLEVKQPPKRKRVYAIGQTRAHYLPFIENVKVGGAAEVPYGDFDVKILSSNISAYCCTTWGTGCAMTARNDETKCIEVIRLS